MMEYVPDQLTVNEYLPGAGIRRHVDTHSAFTDGIAVVSLGSGIVMEFRHPVHSDDHKLVYLAPRSLLVIRDESRYVYLHYIPMRKKDRVGGRTVVRGRRVSLTFRRVLPDMQCACRFPDFCDTQSRAVSHAGVELAAATSEPLPGEASNEALMDGSTAPELERTHVWSFYDAVGDHFSATRSKPWPQIVRFIEEDIPRHSFVADIGCGNGRYMQRVLANGSEAVGSDISRTLALVCRDLGLDVSLADCCALPLRSGMFDFVICIAVIHHLSSVSRRLACLAELLRLTRPGGRVLVCAWALEQDRRSIHHFDQQDCFVPWQMPKHFEKGASCFFFARIAIHVHDSCARMDSQ